MTTMTDLDLDLDALGAAVDAAIAELDNQPEPLAIAQRVRIEEARKHFSSGGDVVIHYHRSKETTVPVDATTTVYNRKTISWAALADQVKTWRNQYLSPRYYIIPRATDPAPEPAPDPETPVFEMKVYQAEPPLATAIHAALTKLYPGDSQTAKEKRAKILKAIADELGELYVYGIDLGGRVPIGDPIELGNAYIEVDAFGDAVRILCDGGGVIWDPEKR